jgi:hypothetical protein
MRFKQEFSFEQRREEGYRVINFQIEFFLLYVKNFLSSWYNCPNIDKKYI